MTDCKYCDDKVYEEYIRCKKLQVKLKTEQFKREIIPLMEHESILDLIAVLVEEFHKKVKQSVGLNTGE